MRVISGSIIEQLYDVKQTNTHTKTHTSDLDAMPATLKCIETNHYGTSQVAFINDNIGYHSIGCGNVSTQAHDSSNTNASVPGAVSLHLYCPPIKQCQIVVNTMPVASDGQQQVGNYERSRIYVRDSGPMYHHTEYGCIK